MTKSVKHCGKRKNCFFCHHVFKTLSAAEASESVYMRESVVEERKITSYGQFPLWPQGLSKSSAEDVSACWKV